MDPLVYPRERTLGAIALVLGLLLWAVLVIGTLGFALIYVLLGFVGYIFAQSAVIAWIKGTGVRLSPQQLPELHARFLACCQKLGIQNPPEAYLLHGDGMFNAFATRFFGRNFVVLLSDIVDAMESQPDGINFYIGHELGHIRRGHLTGHIWRLPILWAPLLGTAYSRAKEYTCDLHGRACCADTESAQRALVALAAGAQQWRHVDLRGYAGQSSDNTGFLGSFHELVNGYPYLTKRVARVIDPAAAMPGRSPFAYLLAMFVPNGGRAGGAGGFLILVMVIAMMVAIGLPAYQQFTTGRQVAAAWDAGEPLRAALGRYYEEHEQPPESLEQAGAMSSLPGVDGPMTFDAETMTVHVPFGRAGTLFMVPETDEGKIIWHCDGSRTVARSLPPGCRAE